MSRSVYLAAPEGESGKSTVALGLVELLARRVGRVGVFRPVTESTDTDRVVELLLASPGIEQNYAEAIGVTYAVMHNDPEAALGEIVRRYRELMARFEVLVVLGSDYTDVSTPNELAFNAKVAANLGAPVILVVHGRGRSPEQIRMTTDLARTELAAAHAQQIAVIANRVEPNELQAVRDELRDDSGRGGQPPVPVWALPEVLLLSAPTVRALQQACDGELVRGNPEWLDRESLGFVVAAMSLPNVLIRLHEDVTVIAPGDRSDLLPD